MMLLKKINVIKKIKIKRSKIFDLVFYRSGVGIGLQSRNEAILHFLAARSEEARDPHPLFSLSWYAAQVPDPGMNPLLHFLAKGAAQGLHPHPLFNPAWYLHANSDHPEAAANPLSHYLSVGRYAGCRVHPLFDARWYLDTYPDVAAAGADPFVHFVGRGATEGRSPGPDFDTRWYLDEYPDVAAAGGNALAHYLLHGAREGRNPSAAFDTLAYLQAYPDIVAAGLNPLLHFVEHGRREGRKSERSKRFNLTAQYGMPRAEFEQWRGALRKTRKTAPVHDEWRQLSLGQPVDRTDKDWVAARTMIVAAIGVPQGGHARDRAAIESARASVKRSAAELDIDCTVIAADEIVPEATGISDAAIVIFMQAGDVILPGGLESLVDAMAKTATLCVFDTVYEVDDIAYPVLQPGANPEHLRSVDSTLSRFAIRGSALRGVASATASNQPRGLLLACLDMIAAERDWEAFVHCAVPVLRLSDPVDEIRRLQTEAIERRPAILPRPLPTVSVVICTKDKGHLLDQLIRHLVEICDDLVVDVVVVSNQTTNGYALQTLARWETHEKVKVIKYDKIFNFSEQCNIAAETCVGDFLLFLNDDIVPLTPDWLAHLLAPFADPRVGATGPLLLYPNERVQHAGMYLGFNATAGHTFRQAQLPEHGYLFQAIAARDVSGMTGAALVMRRSLFEDLNGFDRQLVTILQDLDLCIRISSSGYRIIYIPQAQLLHMESISIFEMLERPGIQEQRNREHEYFFARHGRLNFLNDRYLNPNYDPSDETMRTLSCG